MFTPTDVNVDQLTFTIADWQAQNLLASEGDPAASGNLTFTFRFRRGELIENTLIEALPF